MWSLILKFRPTSLREESIYISYFRLCSSQHIHKFWMNTRTCWKTAWEVNRLAKSNDSVVQRSPEGFWKVWKIYFSGYFHPFRLRGHEFWTSGRTCRHNARDTNRAAKSNEMSDRGMGWVSGNQAPSESRREFWSEVDRFTLVVFDWRNVQCGQHGNHTGPQRGITRKPAWLKYSLARHMALSTSMTQLTWTYTPAVSENILRRIIIRQLAVDVEKPLWHETRCVWVPFFIPCHGPKSSQ